MYSLTIDDEDPFSLWRARAVLHAHRMCMDPHLVNESIGVIRTALGDDWLRDRAIEKDKGTAFGSRAHEIGDCLQAVNEAKVAELVALAAYLKFAAPSPHFKLLTAGLKNDYGSTRLQLALAHRIHHAGASGVAFEPPVANGRRGDIEFHHSGQGFLAECFVPEPGDRLGSSAEAQWLMKKSGDAVKDFSQVLSVPISLSQRLDLQGRKEIVRTVREMGRELEHLDPAGEPCLCRHLPYASISVAVTVPAPAGANSVLVLHPDFAEPPHQAMMMMRKASVPRTSIGVHPSPLEGPTGTHVILWFDSEESEQQSLEKDLGESLCALAAKLEKKIAQTRRDGNWSRLIFVESWHSAQLHRAKTSDLREVERLFGHQGLAGVIFAEHHWDMSIMRHTWKLRVLSAPAIPETTREFFEHLTRVSMDVRVPESVGASDSER